MMAQPYAENHFHTNVHLLLEQHFYCFPRAGWSEGLWDSLRVRGLLEGIRQKSSKSPRPQENRWVTYLEEEDLAALKHRLVTNIRRNLHIILITHSSQVRQLKAVSYLMTVI